MDLNNNGEYCLTNLSKINVLLGKNGCGKSSLLKKLEQGLEPLNLGEVNYVTPERGGNLSFNANVEQNASNSEGWVTGQKRNNQWNQFKEYTVGQFRKLEILILREIEQQESVRLNLTVTFESTLEKINRLLTNVRVERSLKGDFEIFHRVTGIKLDPKHISSGESELIALTIECLTFAKSCKEDCQNILLLDEPDVHLHPDLQVGFVYFLIDLVKVSNFTIIIATHSTAILGGLLDYPESRFSILENGSSNANFNEISDTHRKILPIFGAHPLSNLFNQSPILLVEGEDDERIFQQAVRSANGALSLYPCPVGGIRNLDDFEDAVIELIHGVYDNARAYSLRDRDGGVEEIADRPPLSRFRTSCRSAENLILTDEVLATLDTSWKDLKVLIDIWLSSFHSHPKHRIMTDFKKEGFDRKYFDLKEIRNILVGLTPSPKPWEFAVGQVIGKIAMTKLPKDFGDGKICNFLGRKFCDIIPD